MEQSGTEMEERKSICGHKISFANEQFVLELMVGEGHNFQMPGLVQCQT